MKKLFILLACCYMHQVAFSENTGKDATTFTFDVEQTPFSCYGAYMSLLVNHQDDTDILRLNDLTGRTFRGNLTNPMIEITPISANQPIPFKYQGTPVEMKGSAESGKMNCYFESPSILHICLEGADLKLSGDWKNTVYRNVSPELGNTYIVGSNNIALTAQKGKISYQDNTFYIEKESDQVEIVIEQFYDLWQPKRYTEPRQTSLKRLTESFLEWEKRVPSVPQHLEKARSLAAYRNWSAIYQPRENITRPGMAVSKKGMMYIWSWDHCFHAMGLMYAQPQLAWDQFMIMFDHQNPVTGSLPDNISCKTQVLGYVKPPIHGWTLSHLLGHFNPGKEQLTLAYERLVKWTHFWFDHRDKNKNGMPEYNHGYDSGWDNGTGFDMGFPLESPDLATFLILQMNELSVLAAQLDKPREAKAWKNKSGILLKKLLKDLWKGDKFIAKKIETGENNPKSQSLINYVPLLLGELLPQNIRAKLISDLKRKDYLLTPFGLASESPQSDLYEADGYWRGPIWAPSTMLITEGLRKCGEEEFAKTVAARFCNLCLTSGFSENFDALTGKPLRDSSLSWTSSVFLILAHDYLMD